MIDEYCAINGVVFMTGFVWKFCNQGVKDDLNVRNFAGQKHYYLIYKSIGGQMQGQIHLIGTQWNFT